MLPLYDKEMNYLLCDNEKDTEEFMALSEVKQLNEPIEVKITMWNTGGLLIRIEGLQEFLTERKCGTKDICVDY